MLFYFRELRAGHIWPFTQRRPTKPRVRPAEPLYPEKLRFACKSCRLWVFKVPGPIHLQSGPSCGVTLSAGLQ